MPKSSTQDFLSFEQIKDGIMLLKNKGLRAVLMISSLNFALKSTEEQNAIIYQFQNFLNSLDFSCQILIQSRRLNIVGYLDKLKEIEEQEKNELLKFQIAEYRDFVTELIGGGNIVQKNFYFVVPFSFQETEGRRGGEKIPKISSLTQEQFQRAKIQLLQRVDFVALGLADCGLQAVKLNTLELVELLWSLYHPQEAERGYYPEILPEVIV